MSDNVPLQANPEWKNWTEDLVHLASPSGEYYYFTPRTRDELKNIVLEAAAEGVQVRVSGQRHSQPPLIIKDERSDPPYKPETWLVDMSCYADLGPEGQDQIVADEENLTVTANAGVREDYLDGYLMTKNMIMQTVTAGGFFSLGGMTAVDVHGATFRAPIFSETCVAFEVMGADGEVTTIDESTPGIEGWDAIQFQRVSLGAFGIVTSVTLKVIARPHANTLEADIEKITLDDQSAFVAKFKELVQDWDRVESFFDPYKNEFLLLKWKLVDPVTDPKSNRTDNPVPTACHFAAEHSWGAPYENPVEEWFADHEIEKWQYSKHETWPRAAIDFAYLAIDKMFAKAKETYTDLWLTEAARTAFISYFVELPNLDDEGFGKVWQALQKVPEQLRADNSFHMAGPMEFRFIKAGNTALAGTYSDSPNAGDTWFVNLDALCFVKKTPVEHYPKELQNFFAAIERCWYGELGGMPHNGKMYGFYDPSAPGNESTPPFNPGFMEDVAKRRGDRLTAFNTYRKQRDPDGRFLNDYLRACSIGDD